MPFSRAKNAEITVFKKHWKLEILQTETKMKFFFQVCGLSLVLTFGLTWSNPQGEIRGGSYYFYESELGIEHPEIHQVRLKRQTESVSEKSNTSSVVSSSSSSSTKEASTTTLSPNPESPVSDVSKDDSTKKGWMAPENATMILKDLKDLVDVPDEKINDTLKQHIKEEGFNETEPDDHYKYYRHTFIPFTDGWIDLEKWNTSVHPGKVKTHDMLSKSYRRAATITLSFDFHFYGHVVRNITIATGGFLYTGDYVHSWLAATQYIAPLMANFDTSQDETATVKYADNGTLLVVEWGNVYLQGREGVQMEGPFTFQAILHENGDIIFAYKTIPVDIIKIEDAEHPVKVGLSDAYIIERTIFFVRRKTIYEYHRVSMKDKHIANNTAIYLKALPRCNMKTTCDECLALNVTEIDERVVPCKWCPVAKLCSDGFDRSKQKWLKFNCDKPQKSFSSEDGDPTDMCLNFENRNFNGLPHDLDPSYTTVEDDHLHNQVEEYDNNDQEHFTDSKSNVHHAGVATVTIVILLILTIIGWFLYAYFFPHSCSGQFLIKHRPSRWHWRRGEARYTAASIHM